MDQKKRILTLVTGGFDPIHSGHIAYFKKARELTNYLVVGLNTEEWLKRKKGQYFQSWKYCPFLSFNHSLVFNPTTR